MQANRLILMCLLLAVNFVQITASPSFLRLYKTFCHGAENGVFQVTMDLYNSVTKHTNKMLLHL